MAFLMSVRTTMVQWNYGLNIILTAENAEKVFEKNSAHLRVRRGKIGENVSPTRA